MTQYENIFLSIIRTNYFVFSLAVGVFAAVTHDFQSWQNRFVTNGTHQAYAGASERLLPFGLPPGTRCVGNLGQWQ